MDFRRLVDIDHLEKAALPELLKRIVADPHTLLTYTTISGAGIRILYRVEHDENTLQRLSPLRLTRTHTWLRKRTTGPPSCWQMTIMPDCWVWNVT